MLNALLFVIKTLADLYLLTFLLRFLMQWLRADYYNPLAQFVVTVTNPLVVPARRIIPSAAGLDLATLVVLIGLEALMTWGLATLVGVTLSASTFVLYVALRVVSLTLWFYLLAIFVYVILSWIGQRQYNPIGALLGQLVEPLLAPARRLVPAIGGLDLSPLLVLILLQAVVIALPLPPFLR